MPTLKLTEKSVAALPLPTGGSAQEYYWDAEHDEAIKGFGVVVGRTGVRTFVARAWVANTGKKRKVKIGIAGGVRPDRRVWNVALARTRAKELIGDAAKGIDHNANKRAHRVAQDGALTLRQALALYVGELRDEHKSHRAIDSVVHNIPRLLSAWLDKPLASLTVEVVQSIKEKGRAHKTQTNRLLGELSALWNVARRLRRTSFSAENPVGRLGVQMYKLEGKDAPKRERVNDADMPEWYRRVQLLAPIRRDLQLTALFTGLRDSNVSAIRWEHVNVTDASFQVSVPGEKKPIAVPPGSLLAPRSKTTPFVIPVSPTVVEILRRRRDDNAKLFTCDHGDHGYVFPAWTVKRPRRVVATPESKEFRVDKVAPPWSERSNPKYKATGARVMILPGLHDLRRTFTSVASAAGVSDLDQRVLTNHAIGSRDVHERYVITSFDTLRAAAAKVDAALWSRLRPEVR